MIKKAVPILIAVLFVITVVSCIMIADTVMRSDAEIEDFESLAAITRKPIESESSETTSESSGSEASDVSDESAEAEPKPIFKRNLSPLFERNKDCIGWICIPDTAVDYPVMHTPQDQEKYLHKNFDGERSSSGVPFMQGNNTLDSDNIILYGHNMKNGTMFADIKNYRKESFCAEHPTVEFETARGLKTYTVFAVVQLKNNDSWYSFNLAEDEADYASKIAYITEKALYTTDAVAQYGKQLLTLSTCYGKSKSDRLIVIAVENE
ncbi:MAG: class B sortase [Clostridia bacterium]|nr:class B sortase [Clostridia bacterium]MBO5786947.1 class B sortase [Clostridia bacterium]